jgi:hypothetical protein
MEGQIIERKLLERIQVLLRSEGFSRLETRRSTHAWTLSGERGAIRMLVHVTEADQPTFMSLPAAEALRASDIRMKAVAPAPLGVHMPEGALGIAGASLSRREGGRRPAGSRVGRTTKAKTKATRRQTRPRKR